MNEKKLEVLALRAQIEYLFAPNSWCYSCRKCGPMVKVDEDGQCKHCGVEAHTILLETAFRAIMESSRRPKSPKKRVRAKRTLLFCSVCNKKIRRVYAQCDFDHGDYPRCTTFCHFGKCPCGGELSRADWLKAGVRIVTEPRTFFLNERQEVK